jgi:hypothetical protein
VHLARAGSSGLGLEHGGLDASKCIWLERARAECLRERSEKREKARKSAKTPSRLRRREAPKLRSSEAPKPSTKALYRYTYCALHAQCKLIRCFAEKSITRSEVEFQTSFGWIGLGAWWTGSFKVHSARASSNGNSRRMVALKLQSAIGSSGFERIGIERCGLGASKCIWLERARADWLRALWP